MHIVTYVLYLNLYLTASVQYAAPEGMCCNLLRMTTAGVAMPEVSREGANEAFLMADPLEVLLDSDVLTHVTSTIVGLVMNQNSL